MDTEGVSYAVPFDPRRCELPSGRLGIETGPRLAALFRSGVRPLKDDGKLNLRLYRGAVLCRRPEIKLLNHVQGLRFESRMSSLRHLYARGHPAGRDCALQPDHPVRIVLLRSRRIFLHSIHFGVSALNLGGAVHLLSLQHVHPPLNIGPNQRPGRPTPGRQKRKQDHSKQEEESSASREDRHGRWLN